ncbi:hypothetical protein DPMN_142509 [Dreissena polymorpha]|uniref:Ig-like domain-containing protein n=1 Tax=Dreissena polymorpha TaxID=45954 RepID=A0A9D4GBX0_DREPO|nr:hypothetical protein DPMN_142509 [Dreissena polymorpha]
MQPSDNYGYTLEVVIPSRADVLQRVNRVPMCTGHLAIVEITSPYTPGNPAKTRFMWFHANTSAVGSHQKLSLSNMQLSGEGYYKCRVNNTMDPTGRANQEAYDETTIYVDVQCSRGKDQNYMFPKTFSIRSTDSYSIKKKKFISYFIVNHQETFVIRANVQLSLTQQLLVVDAMETESSVTVQWTLGFNGGEDQCQLSIGELVAGTTYAVKMYAENLIGNSDETPVLSVKTKSVISDQRSSPSVGAAAGDAVGGTLLAFILVMLWKYRKAFKRKPGEAHYDDLFNKHLRDECNAINQDMSCFRANVLAANTSSEYETYKVESQHTNQYETLAETSFHEYSVLSPGGKQDYSVTNRVTQVTETDRDIVNQENAYCAEKKQKRVSCSLDEKFEPAKENVMTPAKLGRTNPGHFHIKNC